MEGAATAAERSGKGRLLHQLLSAARPVRLSLLGGWEVENQVDRAA